MAATEASPPMNLLQVRRILDNLLDEPQDDPDDVFSDLGHAAVCVVHEPQQFDRPELLAALLRRALALSDHWDFKARPPLPQLAEDDSWWYHPAWDPTKELLVKARRLLPPVGPAERAELERQAEGDG